MNKAKIIQQCKQAKSMQINPLIGDWFKIHYSLKEDQNNYVKHHSENIAVKLPKIYKVERQQSTKLLKSAKNRQTVAKLLPAAKALLIYIMFQVEQNQDFVIIDKKEFMSENKISLNTYKVALSQMIEQRFIKESEIKHVYFINPLYIFAGNRLNKYAMHTKKYTPENTTKLTIQLYNYYIKLFVKYKNLQISILFL